MTAFLKISKITNLILCIALLVGVTTISFAQAPGELEEICNSGQASGSSLCDDYKAGQGSENPVVEILEDVINILLFIAGALAVIFVIYGGFKYTKSSGDSNKVSEAKNTILYALIGIVLALVANRLIIFILNWFFN